MRRACRRPRSVHERRPQLRGAVHASSNECRFRQCSLLLHCLRLKNRASELASTSRGAKDIPRRLRNPARSEGRPSGRPRWSPDACPHAEMARAAGPKSTRCPRRRAQRTWLSCQEPDYSFSVLCGVCCAPRFKRQGDNDMKVSHAAQPPTRYGASRKDSMRCAGFEERNQGQDHTGTIEVHKGQTVARAVRALAAPCHLFGRSAGIGDQSSFH